MSESYTIGGNAYQGFWADQWAGQVFSPIQDHILNYIDLNIKATGGQWQPDVYIYYWTGTTIIKEHILSHASYALYEYWGWAETRRMRVKMSPFLLTAGESYAIVIRRIPPPTGVLHQWEYDSDAATYPRGYRILSDDAGETWTRYLDQDHIFVEFGDPPLPKPLPEPPIPNFASLSISIIHYPTGLMIIIPTNAPCHLTCYYTDKKPLKHHTSRTIRGLTVPWATYFCFVAWKEVEQNEPGDTLYHTFQIPQWPQCQTNWFTFRGEVDNIQSPSIGPIFEHHHPGEDPILALTLRPDAPGDLCGIGSGCIACPNHWTCVDETPPDEDTTTVQSTSRWGYTHDLYNIPNPDLIFPPIKHIALIARLRRSPKDKYGQPYTPNTSADLLVKTHGQTYDRLGVYHPITPSGHIVVSTLWTDYLATWVTNPYTNQPWTWQEIKDLQIGIALRMPSVEYTIGAWTYCTQLYLIVYYYLTEFK